MVSRVVYVPVDLLVNFVTETFRNLGVPDEDAAICADVLLEANRRGIDSHGLIRLKKYYYDRIRAGIQQPVAQFEVLRQTATTAVVDGHDGMGMVIAKRSMEIAIDKARTYGMGMVAVRNSSHYGIAGYYVSMAVKAGMIGVTGTNTRPAVAPTFGVENLLGTNPLSIGIPSDEEFPFILDCSTALAQRGKIETHASLGEDIPPHWVIGHDGKTRTDSSAILEDLERGKAALAPLGGFGEAGAGYKGYGYATVVEVLSAALQGGKYLKALSGINHEGHNQSVHTGHFFLAIDVRAFIELETFKKTTGDILRTLRNSKRAPGYSHIYTAGEKEYMAYQDRRRTGIPIDYSLQKEMITIIKELGLDHYNCLFS